MNKLVQKYILKVNTIFVKFWYSTKNELAETTGLWRKLIFCKKWYFNNAIVKISQILWQRIDANINLKKAKHQRFIKEIELFQQTRNLLSQNRFFFESWNLFNSLEKVSGIWYYFIYWEATALFCNNSFVQNCVIICISRDPWIFTSVVPHLAKVENHQNAITEVVVGQLTLTTTSFFVFPHNKKFKMFVFMLISKPNSILFSKLR